jgi:hypothetical protein
VVSSGVDAVTERVLTVQKGVDGALPVARWIERNKTYGRDIVQPEWVTEPVVEKRVVPLTPVEPT